MVEEANPPKPFVSSHSRRKASFKLSQTSRPKRIILSLYIFRARIFDSLFGERNGRQLRTPCVFGRLSALLQQFGDETGPTCLMTGSKSRASVPIEVFVEKQQVAPVGVILKALQVAIQWPSAPFVA